MANSKKFQIPNSKFVTMSEVEGSNSEKKPVIKNKFSKQPFACSLENLILKLKLTLKLIFAIEIDIDFRQICYKKQIPKTTLKMPLREIC